MKKIIYKVGDSHDAIYKVALFIVVFVAIMLVYPSEGRFKYEFQKGKKWMYKDLQAPFDFGVLKTNDAITLEKAQVMESVTPYYRRDTAIHNKVLSRVTKGIDEKLLQNKKQKNETGIRSQIAKEEVVAIKQIGVEIVDSIYRIGFVEVSSKFKTPYFNVLSNNVAVESALDEHLTYDNIGKFISSSCRKFAVSDKKMKGVDTVFLIAFLQQVLEPDIKFDESTTNKTVEQKIQEVSPTIGVVRKGQLIIAKGDIISLDKYQVLSSLLKEYESQSGIESQRWYVMGGQAIVILISLCVLIIFLYTFRKEVYRQNKNLVFLFLMLFLALLVSRITLKYTAYSIYVIPFCVLPIVIRIFFDTRIALFVHLVAMLLVGYMVQNSYEFVFLQIVTGVIAIVSIANLRTRSQLFLSAAIVFATYCLSYIGFSLMQEGSFEGVRYRTLAWFGANASLTLIAYPLLFVFEKFFDFVSDVTLLELSDTNSPVLREMAEKAPGTFQHSLQVANLAEEAIFQIGGNSLLVRTGALYHDIGKMDMPLYFIENQTSGINPHDELGFEESARIVTSHVQRGIEKAKENKIPEQIIDFIRTHHGTSKAQYFYNSYLKDCPKEQVDADIFTYSGPIPYSKESAVLMMADSIEAASRSLKITTPDALENLIDNVINSQMSGNQYMNADITLKDITKIKKIFKKRLINAYHVRIEYPS